MIRKIFLLLCFYAVWTVLEAQEGAAYLVEFVDKKGTPFFLSEPSAFLGQAAIDRRNKQNIQPDSLDLPVNPLYIDSLSRNGLYVHSRSRWMNSAVVFTTSPSAIEWARSLDFVKEVRMLKPGSTKKSLAGKWDQMNMRSAFTEPVEEYGYGFTQIRQVHGDYLHYRGFRGEGIRIAVIDGGFTGANNSSLFPGVFFQDTVNFLHPGSSVFGYSTHGMVVLSVMAAGKENLLKGTAPGATYLLLLSEDPETEYPVEEEYWIAAAEYADSAGADVVNTSLGYSTFDNGFSDHSPWDMDGNTTRISQAATIAATRGMLLVTSAGNLGNRSWKYISAPADAIPVLAVGAVDSRGIRAGFSSVGTGFYPSVKPDIMAMGVETAGFNPDGMVITANGTSLSSPVIAGLAACLWQAFPDFSAAEIAGSIRESGNRFHNPDILYGYGIPDFEKAFYLLEEKSGMQNSQARSFLVYPNPFQSEINVRLPFPEDGSGTQEEKIRLVKILTPGGVTLRIWSIPEWQSSLPLIRLNTGDIQGQGIFVLVIETNLGNYHIKLVKTKPGL